MSAYTCGVSYNGKWYQCTVIVFLLPANTKLSRERINIDHSSEAVETVTTQIEIDCHFPLHRFSAYTCFRILRVLHPKTNLLVFYSLQIDVSKRLLSKPIFVLNLSSSTIFLLVRIKIEFSMSMKLFSYFAQLVILRKV